MFWFKPGRVGAPVASEYIATSVLLKRWSDFGLENP